MEFDRTVVEEVIAETGRRARGQGAELPHPMATDAFLVGHLDAIGSHLIIDETTPSERSTKDKLVDRAAGRSAVQAQFNSHVVHALHQLDHRGRQQREEIRELRAQLDQTNQVIVQLQRRLDRAEHHQPTDPA